jgi:GAF domain-containing protein
MTDERASLDPNPRQMTDSLAPLLEHLGDRASGSMPSGQWHELLRRTVTDLAAAHPHFGWTGIYLVDGEDLVLGPFVGAPTEHVRIPVGQGICGAAAAEAQTIVVDDVSADPRYLACFLSTRSEIVVPIFAGGDPTRDVIGEIDVDSDALAAFGAGDRELLERIAAGLGRLAPERPPAPVGGHA